MSDTTPTTTIVTIALTNILTDIWHKQNEFGGDDD